MKQIISSAATMAILLYSSSLSEEQFAQALEIHTLEELSEVMDEQQEATEEAPPSEKALSQTETANHNFDKQEMIEELIRHKNHLAEIEKSLNTKFSELEQKIQLESKGVA
jgi:DNA-binding NtrC family response regulator